MPKDEFRRAEQRWANRPIFGQPRRRLPWAPIALILALAGAGYALSRNDLMPVAKDLWARSWAPAKPAAADAPERLLPLPLPARPSAPPSGGR